MFLVPNNLGIDIKIIKFELIVRYIAMIIKVSPPQMPVPLKHM